MRKLILVMLLVFLAAVTGLAFFLGSLYQFLNGSLPIKNGPELIVTVSPGMSGRAITKLLAGESLISNCEYFLLIWRLRYGSQPFHAGEYSFKVGNSVDELLTALTQGTVVLHSLTIPEGWDMHQIAGLFEQILGLEARQFLDLAGRDDLLRPYQITAPSLEGFLYPDTYRFSREASVEKVISVLLNRFFQVISDKDMPPVEESGYSLLEVVTLASLIEKETAVENERSIISAVYHNRLQKKMRLQCDPTVIYALPNFSGNLTRKDLDYDSPYNTYRYGGLPPGPICNPGKAALKAAIRPDKVPYLYFVARGDQSGNHVFSTTLDEHNRAVYREQVLPLRRRANH